MHNIRVVFARHEEAGNCNATALHHIIDSARPDIIFEELSTGNFERYCTQKKLIAPAMKKAVLLMCPIMSLAATSTHHCMS
jgi:hypothetical protein